MRKFFLILTLLFVGGKYGIDYITSEEFQKYGDRTKQPWTCYVNNYMGHLLVVMSRYDEAKYYFDKTMERCPETSPGEMAEYESAYCLESMGRMRDAIVAYEGFARHYPESKRAKMAIRATQVINAS